MGGFAHSLRQHIWAEHLGLKAEGELGLAKLSDPLCPEVIRNENPSCELISPALNQSPSCISTNVALMPSLQILTLAQQDLWSSTAKYNTKVFEHAIDGKSWDSCKTMADFNKMLSSLSTKNKGPHSRDPGMGGNRSFRQGKMSLGKRLHLKFEKGWNIEVGQGTRGTGVGVILEEKGTVDCMPYYTLLPPLPPFLAVCAHACLLSFKTRLFLLCFRTALLSTFATIFRLSVAPSQYLHPRSSR